MISLDDLNLLAGADPEGMLGRASSIAGQGEKGFDAGKKAMKDVSIGGVSSIVFCGMGGSAIAGDLLFSSFQDSIKIPFSVRRDYSLPGFAGKDSLVICSSYSGNTEETISTFDEALGIPGVKIVAITSGGELLERSEKLGIPHVRLPSGMRPRSALGSSFFSVLGAIYGMKDDLPGFAKERIINEVRETFAILKRNIILCEASSPEKNNPAKLLARRLAGKFPIAYSSSRFLNAVAVRWKNQFEENSKTLCHANFLPELDHNEIEGSLFPTWLKGGAHAVFLREKDEGERNALRVGATRLVLIERGISCEELTGEGKSALSRTFFLICLGDHASIYLAFLNGVDPATTTSIDRLKEILGGRPPGEAALR